MFQGVSTALLSQACHQLGITLHCLDSFAGLPPSDSVYYQAGDFAGSLEEVSGNIKRFGRRECVEFHPGFFSDTLAWLNGIHPAARYLDGCGPGNIGARHHALRLPSLDRSPGQIAVLDWSTIGSASALLRHISRLLRTVENPS
jgi:hypothetical protein